MEPLRTALERRFAVLAALDGAVPPAAAGRAVLERLLREGAETAGPTLTWSEAERRLVGVLSRAVRARPGECYGNAQRLLLAAERLAIPLGSDLAYCEGYAQLPSLALPFAHAWCLLNGRTWDPTLDRLGVPVRYLGLPLPSRFVFFTLRHRRRLGPVLRAWCAPEGGRTDGSERCLRVGSAVHARAGLGGAPAGM